VKWLPPGDREWMQSECGFYVLCKTLDGDTGRTVYSGWYRPGAQPSSVSGMAPSLLACKSNSAAAARACSAHQRAQAQPQISPQQSAAPTTQEMFA
jgi:hypothetical protein